MPDNYQTVASAIKRKTAQQCVAELVARVAAKNYASLAEILTEDVVLEIFAPKSVPCHGTSRGREAVMKAIELNFSQLDSQEYRLDAVIEQDGMVAMFGHETGRIKGGGEFALHGAHWFTVKDGRISHIREVIADEKL